MDVSTSSQGNMNSLLANSLGRLVFEAGLEPEFVQSPSFKGLIDLLTCGSNVALPSYDHILQVQLNEIKQHEKAVKQLWERSGCSLIFNRWNSRCGKTFVSALVHHNEGMLFLRSMDISLIVDDVDELASMVSEVIDDVGVHNIVQIITNDGSPYMQAVEHAVLKKYGHSFLFTLCADYCVDLLLEKISALDHVNGVLMKARRITRFIYSHALPMKMKELYIPGYEIISNCHMKYVAIFVTLERLVSLRANLMDMFGSPEWILSDLASTNLAREISEIILSEDAFWCAADSILKATSPIIDVLLKLETDNCPMGVLYDAMDGVKEEIKRNLRHEYDIYWELIDHVWDDYLHSPIHAAGYFLNPKIFYSERFCHDTEISSGITTCMLRVAKNDHNARFVADQLAVYQRKSCLFDPDTAAQEAMEIPQVAWWSKYGADTPELQSFAQRILSLTCFGASRYNMDNSLSERLHTEARSYTEQERFRKIEYIYYNLRLRNSVPCLDGPPTPEGNNVKLSTKLGDWISAEHAQGGQRFLAAEAGLFRQV